MDTPDSNPRSLDYESDALPIELKFPYDGLHVKRKIPNGKNISSTASYISHDSVVWFEKTYDMFNRISLPTTY